MSVKIDIKKEVNMNKLISEFDGLGFHTFSSVPEEFIIIEDAEKEDTVALQEIYDNHTTEVIPEETLEEKIGRIVDVKINLSEVTK